jgi:hypothetical protein
MPLVIKNINSFEVKHNQVILKSDYVNTTSWSFKKITGSRFSAILGFSKYTSPFKAFMIMTNLYKDVMDPTLASVGNTVEPLIRDYVVKQLGIQFHIHNPKDIGWDAFKENKIFGGIPDGEPLNNKMVIDYSNDAPMLEIKTTSIDSFVYKSINNELKMQKDSSGMPLIKEKNGKYITWFQNNQIIIPLDYQLQLGLYMYLRKTHSGIFAIGFLKSEDYVHPNCFNCQEREIKLIDFTMQSELFQKYINQGEQ